MSYEVENKANGTTITQTINLPQPIAATYAVDGIEGSASASGTVPADLLQQIPESTCVPGTVQGSVTVLVVVDLLYIYLPHVNPFIVHIESTVLGWDDNPVVVAAATSTGQPFTMGDDPTPTKNRASDSPKPGKIAPIESQSAGNPAGASESGASQSGGSPSEGSQPGGNQSSGSQSGSGQSGSGSSSSNAATPPRETVGTIGTNPVVVGPSSVVIVGSQTVQPGAPGVTIGGSSISVAPSATAIVVNGHTSALPVVANPGSPTQTIGTIAGTPIVVGPSSIVIGTVGSNPIIVGPSSAVVVGTQTLVPGGGVVIVNGSPVSLVPSGNALVIGSTAANGALIGTQTTSLPHVIFPAGSAQAQAGAAPPVLTIGSSTLTANAATQFFIAPGQTLTPGGTATIDGQVVSLDTSAAFIVIGGSTQILPTSPPAVATSPPEIVIDGTTVTAVPNTNNGANGALGPTFVISGHTLVPDHAVTVAGTIISLPLSGSFAVINGVTSTFANAASPLTVAGAAITPLPNPGPSFIIDGHLLTPGALITVSGTTLSLLPSATAIVINGVTTPLSLPTILTLGSHTYTALPPSAPAFLISGQTLTPGGTITVHGTTFSLSPSATALVVNGITTLLPPNAQLTNPPLLTLGTHTYTALPGAATAFVINGQTLTPGGVLVVNGTTISLSPGATQLVYGSAGKSTTEVLFPGTSAATATATKGRDGGWDASAGATQGVGQAEPTGGKTGGACAAGVRWGVLLVGLGAGVALS
ncbi:hypothetical protein SLS60_011543 [Paraconiothyrium brasiliense]|uniref:Uncharacterized protein n=1 Tax=Paraconiothyrium brasiliense TaxID=300254 RepID=A0ABR3QIG6_9PLEO